MSKYDNSQYDDPLIFAIKSLKLFSKLIRGFSKREQKYIVQFIADVYGASERGNEAIGDWLKNLWCAPTMPGDYINVYDYKKGHRFTCLEPLIEKIPDEYMKQCREVALNIALGSKRKPIPIDLINWIQETFATHEEKQNSNYGQHVYIIK